MPRSHQRRRRPGSTPIARIRSIVFDIETERAPRRGRRAHVLDTPSTVSCRHRPREDLIGTRDDADETACGGHHQQHVLATIDVLNGGAGRKAALSDRAGVGGPTVGHGSPAELVCLKPPVSPTSGDAMRSSSPETPLRPVCARTTGNARSPAIVKSWATMTDVNMMCSSPRALGRLRR